MNENVAIYYPFNRFDNPFALRLSPDIREQERGFPALRATHAPQPR